MNTLVEKYQTMPEARKKPMWQILHKLMIRFDKKISVKYMNYGFHHLQEDKKISLLNTDEENRYQIQLYDHVVEKVDLYHKDILEVGSGRGGGASYLNHYYTPKNYTGIDISTSTVEFCNMYYNEPGLSFVKGDATNLPFDDKSFDSVINIESTGFCDNLPKLFNEVYRVLRDDGSFLFADIIESNHIETVKHQLRMAGFTIEYKQDITRNVIAALNEDNKRKEKLIKEQIPGMMKKTFRQFAGTVDSERYKSFIDGKYKYLSFVLKKIS